MNFSKVSYLILFSLVLCVTASLASERDVSPSGTQDCAHPATQNLMYKLCNNLNACAFSAGSSVCNECASQFSHIECSYNKMSPQKWTLVDGKDLPPGQHLVLYNWFSIGGWPCDQWYNVRLLQQGGHTLERGRTKSGSYFPWDTTCPPEYGPCQIQGYPVTVGGVCSPKLTNVKAFYK